MSRDKKKIVIAIILIGLAAVLFLMSRTAGAMSWREKIQGTIVDVDPICNNGASGLFFELKKTKGGHSFVWVWVDDHEGNWPTRGDVGTWYTRKVDGDDKYKWVDAKTTSTKKEPAKPAKPASVRTIPKSAGWQSIARGLPLRDKTVLVRYKNGTIITTAYVNNKKQWKLETDRDRVSGGREIATIKEWRNIPE